MHYIVKMILEHEQILVDSGVSMIIFLLKIIPFARPFITAGKYTFGFHAKLN